ncbi:Haloacid dehalogenase-like hydrolase domain-containing protein 3 [Willisornis vidua]|uniref:Haloacid dehalogenase-like hydrolase domain-containing protein 3 n=1 Tax=Willisornis vidua TaxID=1566151 RepID=A0ABQ9DX99_9PASS|nr:Haloacid dehalogenase-like hydrolase domain-containing protein 3 [Willisornis vidua]
MVRLCLLTWDVKDTLLRLRQPVGLSYAAAARARGLRAQPEALDRAFREAYGAQSRRLPNYGRGQGLSSRQWWLDVVRQTFVLAGVPDGAALAEQLYHDYCGPHTWEPLPGAADTLSRCRQRGFRMGVVSNFDNRLESILSGCDLRHHFDFVLTSEAAGAAKPDGRIFEEALRLGGVPPEQAAHVGDDYTRDYRAARAVGMHSFLLRTAGQQPQPDVPAEHVLASLGHLLTLIEKG